VVATYYVNSRAQQPPSPPPPPPDAVQQAQQPAPVAPARPEQNKSPHDQSDAFTPQKAAPSSPVFQGQPKQGKNDGFDFFRDPLNSDAPMANPDQLMRDAIAADLRFVAEFLGARS